MFCIEWRNLILLMDAVLFHCLQLHMIRQRKKNCHKSQRFISNSIQFPVQAATRVRWNSTVFNWDLAKVCVFVWNLNSFSFNIIRYFSDILRVHIYSISHYECQKCNALAVSIIKTNDLFHTIELIRMMHTLLLFMKEREHRRGNLIGCHSPVICKTRNEWTQQKQKHNKEIRSSELLSR